MFWSKEGDGSVRCLLCPHHCQINEKKGGFCGTRRLSSESVEEKQNKGREVTLVATGYGIVSSIALDPIEKKPLYMFHPGAQILSIGGYGCNLRCPFCQNHGISMSGIPEEAEFVPPDSVLSLALRTIPQGNIGVAYTYNEPFINYEYLMDCARLAHDAGLLNVVVTNGYIDREPLENALPLIDAMNIDLKGFTQGFYKGVSGTLDDVMDTISVAHGRCHVEITTLVIPGENEDDIRDLAKWLSSLNPDIPLHLSRFFPRHNYSDRAPTPREAILRLRDVARGYLNNVFMGNM